MATSPSGASPPAAPRSSRRRWPWLLLAILVLLLVTVALFDWNLLRGPLERRLEAASGRDVAIGHLDVELGWPSTVILDDVRLANPEWSTHDTMARAGQVRLQVAAWPLLRGELVLPQLQLHSPVLLLERTDDEQANWRFGDEDDDADGVAVGQLLVEDGRLRVLETGLDTDFTLAIDSEGQARNGPPPLRLQGDGRYRGNPFSIEGSVDSPLELREDGLQYRVDLAARAGSTRASARGALAPPLDITEFEVQFALEGEDMSNLHPLLGIAVPSTPPYALEGRLSRHRDEWHYRDFSGTAGDSDLAGAVSVDVSGERPMLRGEVHSSRLDFDDLGAAIGAAPGTGPGETASARQRRLAAERAQAGRALPTREYRLERLRAMDADVRLEAAEVVSPRLPIDAMTVRVRLHEGVLRLDPLNVAVAGGSVDGAIALDARNDPIAARADLKLRGLELPRLFADQALARNSMGSIAGAITLDGNGNSVAAMLANADGEVSAMMGGGRVSNLMLELAGLDIAEALAFLLTEDRTVPIRCAYAAFDVEEGTMATRALVLDTSDTVIIGEGTIDLRRERFDLTLHPRPTDSSIAALRVPLEVSGSFRDPDVSPKGGQLALRALAGVALYALAPPAALLAMVETGPGESTGCGRHIDRRSAEAADGDEGGADSGD